MRTDRLPFHSGFPLAALAALLALSPGETQQPERAPHPLDPLSRAEIGTAVQVLRAAGRVNDDSRFAALYLHEPAKDAVLRFDPAAPPSREAFAAVYEREQNKTFEAVVDLRARAVRSWKEIPGAQPRWLLDDVLLAQMLVRADPRWQAAVRKRGIQDFNSIQIDPWPGGYHGQVERDNHRLVATASYVRGTSRNPYARPMEGVIAWVDLNTREVLRVTDSGEIPMARGTGEYDARAAGRERPGLKPLLFEQPEGPSFERRGSEVRWQGWRFRYALHQREGLVLYTVGFEDGARLRPVLYRASVSEMFVPYGDPSPDWYFRSVFDVGEAGLGWLCFPQQRGGDCPQNAALLDAVFAGDTGAPYDRPRVVSLYERDGGIAWKHVDPATGANEVRRARQLVLGCIATVGNYDYAFNWVFHQDGTLEMEAGLTGIMATKGVAKTAESAGGHAALEHGHLVAPNVQAVHHQHWFNFRLDMDVDGAGGNSVVELDTLPLAPGADNPHGNGIRMRETVLRTDRDGRRDLNLQTARKWRVAGAARNSLGGRTAYALLPGENSVPYLLPDAWPRRRAGFINHHLWATPYTREEQFAAGDYPLQSRGGDGLPAWTSTGRPIADTDVVLWYSMGITHIPRPEDWPVMPVHRAGFKLTPLGFFSRNPALDLPRP
jgi:primary-amine oxidase